MKKLTLTCRSTLKQLQQHGAFSVLGGSRMVHLLIDACWRKTEGIIQPQGNCMELWPRVATKVPWHNPVWFFFFGGISGAKKVFKTLPRDINDLHGRSITEVDALRMLRWQEAIIRNVFQGMRAWAEACVWRNDGHPEGRCQRNN